MPPSSSQDNQWAHDPHSVPVQSKKPRHRHAPHQLTALNELFDQNEHPPLEERTALAERLGMETKTVNAWFQNKRASSKKRVRGNATTQSIKTAPPSTFQNGDVHLDDIHDDEYTNSLDIHHSRSASVVPSDYPPSYSAYPDQAHFYSESDNMPRKMRMRPSPEQTEELKKLYNEDPHPSTEQRQALSAKIGMRYQSITNWFQNQRSLAKKRKEDEPETFSAPASKAEYPHETRQYSAYPPPSHPHPSLGLPPATSHPSLDNASLPGRSRSVSPPMESFLPRRSSSRHSTTPYGSASSHFSRPRRTRPEPYQLDALKELFIRNPTPTIEERSALALEIGMDVGKVTNWFRNLRQTARKRARKSGSGDDDEYDGDSFLGRDPYSASASRYGTPSFGSSSSSINEDSMDISMDDFDMHHAHSDNGSEDEYQEAVTPSPEQSPSPPPASSKPAAHPRNTSRTFEMLELPVKLNGVSPNGARYEDALLLMLFKRNIVVHGV